MQISSISLNSSALQSTITVKLREKEKKEFAFAKTTSNIAMCAKKASNLVGSVAERVKACQPAPRLVVASLDNMLIVAAWWLRTSSKFTREEVKRQPEGFENDQLLSRCGFVQRMAPPLISRDRRIKMMHQSINHPVSQGETKTPLSILAIDPFRKTHFQYERDFLSQILSKITPENLKLLR